jgi:hypothetical protein
LRRVSALVLIISILGAMTVMAAPASAGPALHQCISVPAGTLPVYVDTNNDGNPEFYLGSTGYPTVCVDGGPITATYLPSAAVCGPTCVQLTVTVLPAYADVDMTVSVWFTYSDGCCYGYSEHVDHLFTFSPRKTVCVKIGGSGTC